ncbi:MAG: hypothetical protein A2X86_18490 [Bdellovibrionales bacterium GWA2_49_15]|nr:MAG: hypothetical protein A2X86_18490 [Bdellovibrionales bacterium GWA2_49_15]
MITVTPNLTLLELIKNIVQRRVDFGEDSVWNRSAKEVSFFFSASKYALYVVTKALEIQREQPPVLFIPDYFCYRSLELVWSKTSCNIIWYPIDRNFSPDWKILGELAKEHTPDLFLLVHFNGHVDHIEKSEKFCHAHKCLMVEDCANVLFPNGKIGKHSDISFFSPHKSLAVPDGSVLYVKKNLPLLGTIQKVYEGLETEAPSPLKWIFKKILVKLFPAWFQKGRAQNILPFEVDPPMVPLVMKPRMSKLARSILASFSNEKLLAFSESRKRNSEEFLTLLKFLLPDFEYSPMLVNETPYKFAVRFTNSQDTIRAFEILKLAGLWPVSWPDLPPAIKDRSGQALTLRHTTIYLPVHHQLKILNTFRRQLKISADVEILWENVSHEQWDESCLRVSNFNLLQHWEYGDAKKLIANTPIKRGIIYFQKQPIAVVQAFIKKIGFVSLIRVNRGPLFFNSSVSPQIKAAVYQALRKRMGTGLFSFLFIIPELEDGLENRFILSKAGFFRFRGTHSETAWADLTLDADTLRGNLKSKWRNLLKNAEASGLRYTISNTKEDFSWLEKQHVQDMQTKQFSGVPLEMQRQISSLVLIAYLEDCPVAGVMIAHHLNSATYLVGTNSAEGRKCNANNFLLWNAMLEMKKRGCKSFDLGGLGVQVTPHIAHFKRGVSGQEFHYPGEYFTWCL